MFTTVNIQRYQDHIATVKGRLSIDYNNLFVSLCGIRCRVNWYVNRNDCLIIPANYRFPVDLKSDSIYEHILIALKNRRHTYIWGPSGCGKDSLVHAYCYLTKTPSYIFTIRPREDIQSWFFIRNFSKDGAFWEEGLLLKMIRDGYKCEDGTIIPYLILISDFDRADKDQAEALRLVLDSIKGRVKGPQGVTYDILPGTCFVFTGNNPGAGDMTGKYISSNPVDSSLLDRIERKFKFTWMSWEDERSVLLESFPYLFKEVPNLINDVKSVVRKIRSAIETEELFADFSIRSLKSWLGHAEDLLRETGNPKNLLARAMRAWSDGLPDDDSVQLQLLRYLEPLLKGINITGT